MDQGATLTREAVQAASDYGTYVMAHVYNNNGIRRAIEEGAYADSPLINGNPLKDIPILTKQRRTSCSS